jgi:hypothetical protein
MSNFSTCSTLYYCIPCCESHGILRLHPPPPVVTSFCSSNKLTKLSSFPRSDPVPPLPQPQTDLLFDKYYSQRLPIKTNFQQASLRSSILKQAAQNPGKPEIFLTKHKSTTLQAAGTTSSSPSSSSSSSSSSYCSCKSTFFNKETSSTKPKTRKSLTKKI